MAVAGADSSKVVELVIEATVALAGIPVPLMVHPATSTEVSSMDAVVLPLVVSTVLSVKFPLPVSEPSASTAAAPLSTAVFAVRAVKVKVLASTTVTISYSWFSTAAVMLPPRPEQLEKVTKSPSSAA